MDAMGALKIAWELLLFILLCAGWLVLLPLLIVKDALFPAQSNNPWFEIR
jgi:hypothetical protein